MRSFETNENEKLQETSRQIFNLAAGLQEVRDARIAAGADIDGRHGDEDDVRQQAAKCRANVEAIRKQYYQTQSAIVGTNLPVRSSVAVIRPAINAQYTSVFVDAEQYSVDYTRCSYYGTDEYGNALIGEAITLHTRHSYRLGNATLRMITMNDPTTNEFALAATSTSDPATLEAYAEHLAMAYDQELQRQAGEQSPPILQLVK